jgi:hypothetical protein
MSCEGMGSSVDQISSIIHSFSPSRYSKALDLSHMASSPWYTGTFAQRYWISNAESEVSLEEEEEEEEKEEGVYRSPYRTCKASFGWSEVRSRDSRSHAISQS